VYTDCFQLGSLCLFIACITVQYFVESIVICCVLKFRQRFHFFVVLGHLLKCDCFLLLNDGILLAHHMPVAYGYCHAVV